MSLRFQGNQLLQTSPSPLLSGASVVSVSMWIRINSGSNVANPAGVRIFGDGAGRLSVDLSGGGQLGVLWSPSGPSTVVGNSSWSGTLTPDLSYHLALTWEGGLQRYFLNGQVVATDTQQGTLGAPNATPAPFRLGSDSAGVDVTIDEPTVWVGYLITGTDIVNLRDRIASPSSIAPGSAAVRWSLAGPDGVAARLGDPGLADGSPSKLAFSNLTGTGPAYVAGDLTFQAPARIASASVTPSGRMVVLNLSDAAGNPADVASLRSNDDIQVISLLGEPAHGSFTLTFEGQTTAPIPVTDSPPAASVTWTYTGLTAGTPYYIRTAWHQFQANYQLFLVEVFDGPGGARLQHGYFDSQLDNSTTYDFQALIQGDQYFTAVSSTPQTDLPPAAVGVTPTGTSLVIRVTGQAGSVLAPVQVHCTPHDVSLMKVYFYQNHRDYVDFNDSDSYYKSLSDAVLAGNWQYGDHTTGSGFNDTYTTTASAIQAALQGLAGGVIPPGGVQVSGTVQGGGPDLGPFIVRFTGSMSGAQQASLVSSDPAVLVLHDDTGGSTIGGQHPTLSVDGTSILLLDLLWGAGSPDSSGHPTRAPYLPILVYLLPGTTTIAPSSIVTFSAPAGFCSTTAGPTSKILAFPVQNPGSILPAFSPAAKTIRIGYNIEPDNYFSPNRVYSNLATLLVTTSQAFPSIDSNYYPLKMTQSSQVIGLADQYTDYGGAGKGANCFPQGRYRFLWDGASRLSVLLNASTTSTPILSNLTGSTGNEMVLELRDPGHFSPGFYLTLTTNAPQNPSDGSYIPSQDGTYPCDLRNLRIYPPDPADPSGNTVWANPPKYYPSLANQFGKAACFRTMDAMGTNFSNHVDYSDLITASRLGYSCSTKFLYSRVNRVEAYSGPYGYLAPDSNKTMLLFTTDAPHGFITGQSVTLNGIGQVQTAGGNFDPSGLTAGALVVSPTTFAIGSPITGSPMTNVLTPSSASVYMNITGSGMPFTDMVDLANFLNCDLWLNIPALASDDCVHQMATYVATNLKPGLSAHVEWSNECWNFAFGQYFHCAGMSNTLLQAGYGNYPYQVYRSAQVHAIFAAAFTAAGIPTRRLRRVIGTTPYSQGTGSLLDVLQANPTSTTHNGSPATLKVDLVNGTTSVTSGGSTTVLATYPPLGAYGFDEIACSDYVSNDLFNGEGQYKAITDTFDPPQIRDLLSLKVASNTIRDGLKAHVNLIKASSLATKPAFVMYECNWDELLPFTVETNDFTVVPNEGSKIHAVQYHPDMYGITLGLIQQWQDAGVSLANIFYLNGGNGLAAWNAYMGHSMVAGLGTEPGASNVSDPTNLPMNRSVFGGAVNRWRAFANALNIGQAFPGRRVRPSAKGSRAW